jgi:hypothetical protein
MLTWHRRQIIAGGEKTYEIHRHLDAAQIVLIYRGPHYDNSPINELEGEYAYAIQRRRKKNLQIIDIDPDQANTKPLDLVNGSIEQSKKDFAEALKRANSSTKRPLWQKILFLIIALLVAFSLFATGTRIQSASSPSPTVSVGLTLQTQPIIQLQISFSASSNVSQVDLSTKTIPAYYSTYSAVLSSPRTPTTGQVNCILGGLGGCDQGVSQDDIDRLSKKTEPQLEAIIRKNLPEQIESIGGMQSGSITFLVENTTANPQVNQPGKNFTVTMLEAGSAAYVLTSDIAKLVLPLLIAQTPIGYQIIETTLETKQFAMDKHGNLSIEAGVWACYQFPRASLDSIRTALEGKSVTEAETSLKKLPGIDSSNIQIHFTQGSGNYLPGDSQHIKLSVQCPTNLPPVPLP